MNHFVTYLISLFSFDSKNPLLFTQFNFWAFFLVVFAIYACIVGIPLTRKKDRTIERATISHRRRLIRNGYLFFVSLLFYYKTSGLFVLLLILNTFLGWALGIIFDRMAASGQQRGRKALMILGVVINLGVLFYFKYAYFFTDIYNTITASNVQVINLLAQWSNHFTSTARFDASVILLPVGISFFTFQNISYIVDVYKGKVRHAGNLLDFGFYTTFFPQLVAGPIIRADQFIPQLYKPFFLGRRQFGIAIFWILNGLIKKLVLSDYLAVSFVDRVFDNPLLYTPFENFAALLVYSMQVYADFSGYTDIAIGVAMLMGFYLPTNFNSPYKATNAAGFWKRWHMSLSNWLKDYLYIPLGGNRNGSFGTYAVLFGVLIIVALMSKTLWTTIAVVSIISIILAIYIIFPKSRRDLSTNINNMDTMLLGGLWHGASFNFITWGGLNGLGILVYKNWKKAGPWVRIIVMIVLVVGLWLGNYFYPCPLLSMLSFITNVTAVGILILNIVVLLRHGKTGKGYDTALLVWNTLLTFVFISFTRLFFRSGSNLNPAEANEVAWRTATQMVERIGSQWDVTQIPAILSNYWGVFVLFAFGMFIHWLPTHFKRRYRLWMALMPTWTLLLVTVGAVVILYQFVTADLQPFIYFQF